MQYTQIIPAGVVLHFTVPDLILNDLHNYTDEVIEDKQYYDKRNASPYLAANIEKQFFLNQNDPRVNRFCSWQHEKAKHYIKEFLVITSSPSKHNPENDYPECDISTEDIWSVHSFENDYNPIHSHNVKTGFGLATVTYTKLPESMVNTTKPEEAELYNQYGLFENDLSGITDGFISVQAGQQKNIQQLRNFEPTQQIAIKPKVGLMIMFPIWMNHCVYPFKGTGERRSVASNLVINMKEDIMRLQ